MLTSTVNLYSLNLSKLRVAYPRQKPPRKTPEPFATGIVFGSNSLHTSITFSPDGKLMIWGTMGNDYTMWYMTQENGVGADKKEASFLNDPKADNPEF